MFTGIVREVGTVAASERSKGLVRLTVSAPRTAARVQRLESVAVNGVCLTVVDVRHGALVFEAIRETARVTTVGRWRSGSRVHLEPSLSLSDPLGGHLLFGHVDGIGMVVKRLSGAGGLTLELAVSPRLRRFLVPKGPVAVDGISLTVGRIPGASAVAIHLIPETIRQTTLGSRVVGDRVNVEIDYLAKLTWQYLNGRVGRDRRG